MNSPVFLFILFSFLVLFFHWRSDRKTFEIDQRPNYFMLGLGLAIAVLGGFLLWFLSILGVVFVVLWWFFPGEDILGLGDKQVLLWLLPGLVFLGAYGFWPVIFLFFFVLVLLVDIIFKVLLNRNRASAYVPGGPGLGKILLAFVFVVVAWFL